MSRVRYLYGQAGYTPPPSPPPLIVCLFGGGEKREKGGKAMWLSAYKDIFLLTV